MRLSMCVAGLLGVGWLSLATPGVGQAQALTEGQLDSLVGRVMRTFHVPGVALAIVKDGRVAFEKGYGVRVANTQQPVDANTLFAIASNSKAFTAAALGILVDEGKLRWDDKVLDYLPGFRMYDPYVTTEVTIRDLLTHRSGLGLAAGDLMRTPDSTRFTVADVIYNLRYLKPATSFRSGYAYDNILYLVAGEVVAKVSGQSWDDFIEQRLLAPLHMRSSRAAYRRLDHPQTANVVLGHREAAGRLQAIPGPVAELDAGAGGLYSSAADMSRWMLVQLANGRYGPAPGQQLFSAAVAQEMWTPQVLIPASKDGVYNTHFGAYGLGWFMVDVKGYKEIFHTGQDEGQVSEITLLPELGLGITVLTNQENGGAINALTEQLVDGYLGLRGTDRVREWAARQQAHAQATDQATAAVWQEATRHQAQPAPDFQPYLGTYRDPWLGEVRITSRQGALWFQAVKSPQLRGPLLPYRGTAFVVRWQNPLLRADAFVVFGLDTQGQAQTMTMQAVAPAAAPAYDFQDLNFQRVTK